MTRVLGLDVGDRRIGVAVSDTLGILASPHTIIERQDEDKDLDSIINIINQYQICKVIAGLPRSLNGSIGQQAEKVKVFIEALCKLTPVPVEFRDERLTTVYARRLLQSAGKKSKKKSFDDAAAAALILQGYLDEKTG